MRPCGQINTFPDLRKTARMPDYQQGKIYALRSPNTASVYVGSTTVPLSNRFKQHKAANNGCCSRQIIEAGEARIELVEDFPCASKQELNRREGEIMRTMANCINMKIAVQRATIEGPRGYVVYKEDDFFLVVSEVDKKTHMCPRDPTTPIPPMIQIDGIDIFLSHVCITDSRLFSACREYVYDRERRS